MSANTHCLRFAAESQAGIEDPAGVSWTGVASHNVSGDKSGVAFSFAAHLTIEEPNANEAYSIVINLQGTTIDNEKWYYEITLPFTNMGRVPFKFTPEDAPFSRRSMAMDPGVWSTRPELVQEYINGDYVNEGFVQFVPTYTHSRTDNRGQLISHYTNTVLISKELYDDPVNNGPTGQELLQNKIRAPLWKTGEPAEERVGWIFVAGHLGNHGDGFISINGERTYFTYGDASLDISALPEADQLQTWQKSFASLVPGTVQADFVVVPCADSRFVTDRIVAASFANIWVGLTELYGYKQAWIDRLYDHETGRTLDCGDGSMVFEGPTVIKPILYINPTSISDPIKNRIDGRALTIVKDVSVERLDNQIFYPRGNGTTKFAIMAAEYTSSFRRGECIITTDPKLSGDEAKDTAYYAPIKSQEPNGAPAADNASKVRPFQSILPLPAGNSYNQFFMAIELSLKTNITFVINNNIDTTSDGRVGHQIGSRTHICFKSNTSYPYAISCFVSHIFNQGGPNELAIKHAVPFFIDVSTPATAANRMSLVMINFNCATDNYISTNGETPRVRFECVGSNRMQGGKALTKSQIDVTQGFAHINGPSVAISMHEDISTAYHASASLGGVWLYSQDMIAAHPEIEWSLPTENSMRSRFAFYDGSIDGGAYRFSDTGADGSKAMGFKPALYIDPSVGLHCNAAHNAMQIGDDFYPDYNMPYIQNSAPITNLIRPTYASSSGTGIVLRHIPGLHTGTVIA